MIGLSIAGFDPSGGAGILTDIKTMAAHGIHGTSAITALTAQNPKKVFSVEPVATSYICEQIDSIFDEYTIKYSKTGLLYSKDIIKLVSKKVEKYDLSIVVDPVMVASAGDMLASGGIVKPMKKYLLKKSLLVTPNVSEAEELSGIKIENLEDAKEAAYKIGEYCNVIITGGHLNGNNVIYKQSEDEIKIIKQELIETDNLHGTGCSFSAAIVSNLIKTENNNNNNNNKINNSTNSNNHNNLDALNELDNLELCIKKSLEFIYKSVENGRYGTLNPNFKNIY